MEVRRSSRPLQIFYINPLKISFRVHISVHIVWLIQKSWTWYYDIQQSCKKGKIWNDCTTFMRSSKRTRIYELPYSILAYIWSLQRIMVSGTYSRALEHVSEPRDMCLRPSFIVLAIFTLIVYCKNYPSTDLFLFCHFRKKWVGGVHKTTNYICKAKCIICIIEMKYWYL